MFTYVTNSGLREIQAEPIKIAWRDCFIFKDLNVNTWEDVWNVTDCETGMRVGVEKTKEFAIRSSEGRLEKHPEAVEKGKEIIKSLGYKPPINKNATQNE